MRWDNPPMAPRPRILVTNDDGFASEGLQVLAETLEGVGEVWIVGPTGEQSAVSHALTLDRPLRMVRLGERRFTVDGTPTDCVSVAISHLLRDHPPDLVVSGINFGPNMGADVHYSGTVSAAFEGVILGIPAIAISQELGEGFSFRPATRIAADLSRWVLERGLPPETLLNVNVPVGRARGVKLVRLGVRRYTEGVVEDRDPRGRQIFWIGGGKPVWEAIPDTDFHELAEGWVTATPLQLDLTSVDFLNHLRLDPPPWIGPAHAAEEAVGG